MIAVSPHGLAESNVISADPEKEPPQSPASEIVQELSAQPEGSTFEKKASQVVNMADGVTAIDEAPKV